MTAEQPVQVSVDDYSLVPMKLTARFGETELATGTCFAYRHASGDFLITNWHNVTGRNPNDLSLLDKRNAGVPDNLNVALHAMQLGRWHQANLQLYSDAGHQVPVWFVHPQHRRGVDAVAIRLAPLPANTQCFPVNTMDKVPDLQERIGEDVFVLGYPRGLTGGALLPIWKRGTIATEPMFDHDQLPRFLIDTATREGMSGAPVIARANSGSYRNTAGVSVLAMRAHGLAPPTKFIGIYSGRIPGAIDLEAQVGIVWKARVIEEIILGGQQGRMDDCES